MATNLVSYVMQFLTPDMVSRIAAALGLNRSDAQSGMNAAVPALLAEILLGSLVDRRIGQDQFRRIVMVMILALGLALLLGVG